MYFPSGDHLGSDSFRSLMETIFLRSLPEESDVQSSTSVPKWTTKSRFSADRDHLGWKHRRPRSTMGKSSFFPTEYFQIVLVYSFSPFVCDNTNSAFFPSEEMWGEWTNRKL